MLLKASLFKTYNQEQLRGGRTGVRNSRHPAHFFENYHHPAHTFSKIPIPPIIFTYQGWKWQKIDISMYFTMEINPSSNYDAFGKSNENEISRKSNFLSRYLPKIIYLQYTIYMNFVKILCDQHLIGRNFGGNLI